MDRWGEMKAPAPRSVEVRGVELRRGSKVRLMPRGRSGDVFDIALAGQVGVVEGIDQDDEGKVHLAVTLEDDPGRDLGEARYPGHRFFFSPDEVEPLDETEAEAPPDQRILVAGIGNVFLGDDGFGVEVVKRLAERGLPAGVDVVDFGIRGMDLVFALQDGYDGAIFVDTVPRGGEAGTLYVIEVDLEEGEAVIDTHGMDPVKVLGMARELGGAPVRTLVVGCEPQNVVSEDSEDVLVELSEPVRAAVDEAVRLVESLLDEVVPEDGQVPNGGQVPAKGQAEGEDPLRTGSG